MERRIHYMEITGWNREGESVEDSDYSREGESELQLQDRLQVRSQIVEIGDVTPYYVREDN